MNKSANTAKTDKKRKPPKSAWKPGQSGNPAGRPKDGQSWSAIISEAGNMYANDLLAFIGTKNDMGKQIATFPKNVQLKWLVILRVYAALMFEPTSGLLKEFLDRLEGKVSEHIDVTSGNEKLSNLSDEQKILRIIELVNKANDSKS